MKKLVLITAALALSAPAFGQAPQKDQLPTGKQYLISQLAAAEARVSDMLDEITKLTKERDALRDMLAKREEPKK
jgi:predicted trehalose synthase